MAPLIVGTLLAIGALVFVLFPLFAGAIMAPVRLRPSASDLSGAAEMEAIIALREIEFDRATGKLSDSDYDELRARYTERALDAMRKGGPLPPGDDPIEAAVSAYRSRMVSCADCGPRPEPDAFYCSSCGRYLPGACGGCGSPVSELGATFCARCGRKLAA